MLRTTSQVIFFDYWYSYLLFYLLFSYQENTMLILDIMINEAIPKSRLENRLPFSGQGLLFFDNNGILLIVFGEDFLEKSDY